MHHIGGPEVAAACYHAAILAIDVMRRCLYPGQQVHSKYQLFSVWQYRWEIAQLVKYVIFFLKITLPKVSKNKLLTYQK